MILLYRTNQIKTLVAKCKYTIILIRAYMVLFSSNLAFGTLSWLIMHVMDEHTALEVVQPNKRGNSF